MEKTTTTGDDIRTYDGVCIAHQPFSLLIFDIMEFCFLEQREKVNLIKPMWKEWQVHKTGLLSCQFSTLNANLLLPRRHASPLRNSNTTCIKSFLSSSTCLCVVSCSCFCSVFIGTLMFTRNFLLKRNQNKIQNQ